MRPHLIMEELIRDDKKKTGLGPKPIVLRRGDEVKEFNRVKDAAAFLGKSADYVSHVLHSDRKNNIGEWRIEDAW
jgi:hypothetical protein